MALLLDRRGFTVALLAALACGGPPEPRPFETELTAPWTAMGLPVDGGRVVFSDEKMLVVHFDGGAVPAQTTAWSAALQQAGLSRGSDTSAEDMTSITWNGPEQVVALGVWSREGRAEVSLTRYPRSK